MKSTSLGLSILLGVFTASCGGSDKDVKAPAGGGDDMGEAAMTGHLKIVPFTLTITGTKSSGETSVAIIRGTADGVISGEKNGETRDMLKVDSSGTFTPLMEGGGSIVFNADGTLSVDGKPIPNARITDDGSLYKGDELLLRTENGTVIDVSGMMMKSSVTMNGQEVATSSFEMTYEGGDDARRLIMAVLALQQFARPSEMTESEVEATSAPEMVPADQP